MFPILELPLELRQLIYDFHFSQNPDRPHAYVFAKFQRKPTVVPKNALVDVATEYPALLRVNRQIHAEAKASFYKNAYFLLHLRNPPSTKQSDLWHYDHTALSFLKDLPRGVRHIVLLAPLLLGIQTKFGDFHGPHEQWMHHAYHDSQTLTMLVVVFKPGVPVAEPLLALLDSISWSDEPLPAVPVARSLESVELVVQPNDVSGDEDDRAAGVFHGYNLMMLSLMEKAEGYNSDENDGQGPTKSDVSWFWKYVTPARKGDAKSEADGAVMRASVVRSSVMPGMKPQETPGM
ncbi:hypothetical protein MMC25_000524 [Agyrium rufum]|nr:hypothetical protein [Agyrium rufum]